MFGWIKKKLFYKGVDMAVNEAVKRTPTSWRTTLLGLGGTLAIIGQVLQAMFDGDPATNVDWSITIPALTATLGLLFARDQKAHDLDAPKDPSKRSGALTGVFILVCLLGVGAAQAQDTAGYGAFIGGSIDGDGQNAAGNACATKLLSESFRSASCVSMRGASSGSPTYDFSQLFLRTLARQGKLEFLAGGGGGVLTDSDNSAGLLELGVGVARHDIWNGFGLAALLRGNWSPGNDLPDDPNRKLKLRITVGPLWEPTQP